MKKKRNNPSGILKIVLLFVMLSLFAGCSAQQQTPEVTPVPVPSAAEAPAEDRSVEEPELPAGDSPVQAVSLSEAAGGILPDMNDLAELPAEDLSDLVGIEPEEYTDFLWLSGNGLDGREILVLRAVDTVSADHISKQLSSYLEQRRKETQNYLPDVYRLLTAAEISRKNNTVVLIVGPGAEAETAAILAGE